jgi:hypothetical protein
MKWGGFTYKSVENGPKNGVFDIKLVVFDMKSGVYIIKVGFLI